MGNEETMVYSSGLMHRVRVVFCRGHQTGWSEDTHANCDVVRHEEGPDISI